MKKIRNFINTLLLCGIVAFTFSACGGGGGGGGGSGDGSDSSGGGTQQPTKTEVQGKILRFTGSYINNIEFVTESTVGISRNGKAYAGSYTLSASSNANEFSLTIRATSGSNSNISLNYTGRLVFSSDEMVSGTYHYAETLTGETTRTGVSQHFSVVQ